MSLIQGARVYRVSISPYNSRMYNLLRVCALDWNLCSFKKIDELKGR